MPLYEYKALMDSGAKTKGILSADTLKDARDRLRKQGIHVTDISESQKIKSGISLSGLFHRTDVYQLAIISGQLSTLLASGVALSDALLALIEQTEDKKLGTTLRDIRDVVVKGGSFAYALSRHPSYFNSLFINMVKAGEASGTLDAVFERLRRFYQAQYRLRSTVMAAMAYPIITITVGICVIIVLMTWVVPRLEQLFMSRHLVLPLPTRILQFISMIFQHFWWLIIGAFIIFFVLLRILRNTKKGRDIIDRTSLRIPLFGSLIRKQIIARFSSTFSTLLKSGIPVLESLDILKDVVDNTVFTGAIEFIRKEIISGKDIATPLKASGVFPSTVGHMVAVGEKSGELEKVLDNISQAYEDDIWFSTQKITAVIGPMMVLLLAGVVLFIVISIILPILDFSKIKGFGF